MAQRRMFSKEITSSDMFVDMPMSSQLLYYHLGMEADDEGFIGNAKMLSRAYGMNHDDLKILVAKGLIIQFETGVTVIKDWNINNKIRNDRIKRTIYEQEKSLLTVDTKGSYKLSTKWQPNDNQMTTKCPHRIGKDRIGKDRIGEDRIGEDRLETDLKEISDFYQQEIGVLSPSQFQQLSEYITEDGFEKEVVIQAIEKSASAAKRSFSYINAILKTWRQNNIKTVIQVEEEQRNFKEKQQTGMSNKEREKLKEPDEFYGF